MSSKQLKQMYDVIFLHQNVQHIIGDLLLVRV